METAQGKLHFIVSEINSRAKNYEIGNLQEIRKELKEMKRQPSQKIFAKSTTSNEWAFHLGGRPELQFNVGLEKMSGKTKLRYGVAFSLERSRAYPNIVDILIPKIILFNEFIQDDSEKYADMRMWHHLEGQPEPSSKRFPSVITPDLMEEGMFIFLGQHQGIDQIDFDVILRDFDRLLPLYKFTMRDSETERSPLLTGDKFSFRPGCTVKPPSTAVNIAQKKLDISLRHNVLQESLYNRLSTRYGKDNVGTEIQSSTGSVDLVVHHQGEYWFYEIKTAHSSRACIRQAIGQLLEYSFWPGGQEADRLVIVGEPALDSHGKEYLNKLNDRFSLPIEYEQMEIG